MRSIRLVQKRHWVAVRRIIEMSNILFNTETPFGGHAPDIAMTNALFSTEAPRCRHAPNQRNEKHTCSEQKRPELAVHWIMAMRNILFSTETHLGDRAPDHGNE